MQQRYLCSLCGASALVIILVTALAAAFVEQLHLADTQVGINRFTHVVNGQ